jgi:hypothetical protein
MSGQSREPKPAPAPGDAEAPNSAEKDSTAQRAVRHSDRTEPVQSEAGQKKSS